MRDDPKVLLLRFSSLGDVVLATAAARAVKEQRPRSQVILATKAAFAPLLEGQPDLDAVWALEPEGLGALVRRARAAGLDAVVDLHSSLRSRLVAALAGAPATRWQSAALNRRLRVRSKGQGLAEPPPVYQRYGRAVQKALGLRTDLPVPLPRLKVDPAAAAWAGDWLAGQGWTGAEPLLAVSPGAAWATKRWPHLAACLRELAGDGKVRLLLLGSRAEAPLLDSLCADLAALPLAPLRADAETGDLRRLAALLARCRHFLGHDSGPMHVAEALGLPLTALFGPTVRAFGFYPQSAGATVFERDLGCRPCHPHGGKRCPLGHHDCLAGLAPEPVAAQLRRALGLA
ncbi:MAG TPA: glycosyltransferase family 9 protein [bacterium]|jgi:heptosyltransferase-2|nr:glycosyltransferase family 9 protein [bacterium]